MAARSLIGTGCIIYACGFVGLPRIKVECLRRGRMLPIELDRKALRSLGLLPLACDRVTLGLQKTLKLTIDSPPLGLIMIQMALP